MEQYQFLPESFTKYLSKIGLTTSDNAFLSENSDVVLEWPYKDCILEGGQDKESLTRQEVFYNPVTAADKISTLLDRKVLTNWQRYNSAGEHVPKLLKPDDNLIIKGNNLVVLHSLKSKFAGKIKLIYIDVPYNTGKDIFNYNDTFKHSTWLTFMKNRLEIARELLAADGTIFVQADWHEVHYLKVLLDEIFGRDNLINEIIWCYTGPGSSTMKQLNRKHDTILWYSKTSDNYTFNKDAVRVPYADPHQSMRKSLDNGSGWTKEDEARMRERGRVPDDWWSDISVAARTRVDGIERTGYSTEKPFKLLDRIIKMASNEGDLVLDFFAGSGTTLYSAARLKRHFIGIEQMRGAYRLMLQRMKETGNFVSCELLNDAENFVQQIQQADEAQLANLFNKIKVASFLSYQVNPENLKLAEFSRLPLEAQRAALIEMVDKNSLYVNYADINDPLYAISDDDKKINAEFYAN